jgi:hypothetical protein
LFLYMEQQQVSRVAAESKKMGVSICTITIICSMYYCSL